MLKFIRQLFCIHDYAIKREFLFSYPKMDSHGKMSDRIDWICCKKCKKEDHIAK
jgi:hypothetical protein